MISTFCRPIPNKPPGRSAETIDWASALIGYLALSGIGTIAVGGE
jgi:hypothetical protein